MLTPSLALWQRRRVEEYSGHNRVPPESITIYTWRGGYLCSATCALPRHRTTA